MCAVKRLAIDADGDFHARRKGAVHVDDVGAGGANDGPMLQLYQ